MDQDLGHSSLGRVSGLDAAGRDHSVVLLEMGLIRSSRSSLLLSVSLERCAQVPREVFREPPLGDKKTTVSGQIVIKADPGNTNGW